MAKYALGARPALDSASLVSVVVYVCPQFDYVRCHTYFVWFLLTWVHQSHVTPHCMLALLPSFQLCVVSRICFTQVCQSFLLGFPVHPAKFAEVNQRRELVIVG